MNLRPAAALAALLMATPAWAEEAKAAPRADLSAPKPKAPALPPAPPAEPKTSATLTGTALGVAIGAGLMLVGSWMAKDDPNTALTVSRVGLGVMVAFPLVGMSMDMQASSTWEAVPQR